jgi:hypothetical protein
MSAGLQDESQSGNRENNHPDEEPKPPRFVSQELVGEKAEYYGANQRPSGDEGAGRSYGFGIGRLHRLSSRVSGRVV